MKKILIDTKNNWPFLADFNNRDINGSICGFNTFTTMEFENVIIEPIEGQKVWLSDGELEIKGELALQGHLWTVIPDEEGFKDVDEKASYHNKNLSKINYNNQKMDDENGNCKKCNHPFGSHLVIAYDKTNLSKGGEIKCPVESCSCSFIIDFNLK
ncbi:MAG: hypothetical protein WCI93_04255 [bacterium]